MSAALVAALALASGGSAVADPISHPLQDYFALSGNSAFFRGTVLTHADPFQIDLSALITKYIGNTEQNLDQLFARAESSDVVLLFDEADALSGKRTDVKDSHDRFAQDFIVLDPATDHWHGQIALGQGDGVPDGIYELTGTFSGLVAVPEPATLALLGFALAGLGVARRRRAF